MINAIENQQKYIRKWDENLVKAVEVYGFSSQMCDLSMDEMMNGLPTMLDEDVLIISVQNLKSILPAVTMQSMLYFLN